MINATRRHIEDKLKKNTGGYRKQVPWWGQEMALSTQRGRQSSTWHRRVVKGGDEERTVQALECFPHLKQKAFVQIRMQGVNATFMRTLKESGRNAPQRFWGGTKQETATRPKRSFCTDRTAKLGMLGTHCIPYIKEWFEGLLASCPM